MKKLFKKVVNFIFEKMGFTSINKLKASESSLNFLIDRIEEGRGFIVLKDDEYFTDTSINKDLIIRSKRNLVNRVEVNGTIIITPQARNVVIENCKFQ